MKARLLALGLSSVLLGGCALPTMPSLSMPSWMPLVGKKPESAPAPAASTDKTNLVDTPKPGDVRQRPTDDADESVTDRVIAVVNNDAITLAELQESVASRRSEARQQQRDFADDAVLQDSLNQLIEFRLQLQEAEREKILVDEIEVTVVFNDRIKRYGMKNEEEFE